MASIRKEILIDVPVNEVWAAISDFGAVQERAARGFVLATQLVGDTRILTFAGDLVVREKLVDVDHAAHRISYAATAGRIVHHNASQQVFHEGPGRSRVVWITDVIPDELSEIFERMLAHGAVAMKETIEAASG